MAEIMSNITYTGLSQISRTPELYQIRGFDILSGFQHVITGRNGGVSSGECSSLNVSYNIADDADNVRENRGRIYEAVGFFSEHIYYQQQVHEDKISIVPDDWKLSSGYTKQNTVPRTDAMITAESGNVLIGSAADCLLIALYDPKAPAVAIIHAGWRSTMKGIVAQTVSKLIEYTGSSPDMLYAGFSPSAGPCCYEVGPELIAVAEQDGWVKPEHFVEPPVHDTTPPGKTLHLDLWSANIQQLISSGIQGNRIFNPKICTMCHYKHFFSYRILGRNTGSHCMMIWLSDE